MNTSSVSLNKVAAISLLALVAAFIPVTAQAATAAKAGAGCSTAGASATVAGKKLTCTKSASTKKLTWTAAAAKPAAGLSLGTSGTKTAIGSAGGPGMGNGDGGRPDFANNPNFQAFQKCLTAAGVTSFFGRHGGADDQNGTPGTLSTTRPTARPTAGTNGQPFTRPTPSAADQAAITACEKSTGFTMPTFRGGPDDQNGGMNNQTPGGLTLPKSTATPKAASAANSAFTAALATYIACLNSNGLTTVKTAADVKNIDPTISANATALAACADKKPTK